MNSPSKPSDTPSSGLRGWRIGVITLIIVAGFVAAGYFALRRAYPPARLASMLAEQVTVATGREFHIHGKLSIRLGRSVAVEAHDVVLANVEWGSQPEMLRIRRAAFGISFRDLLGGRIRIVDVELEGAQVLLESDGAGRFNWQLAPRERPATKGASMSAPERIVLSDARITFKRPGAESPTTVTIEGLEFSEQGERGRVAGGFKLGQKDWRVGGETGRLGALLEGAAGWPFDLQFVTDGAAVSAKGEAGTRPGNFEAKVSVHVGTAAAVAPLDLRALPMPVHASATLRRNEDRLSAETLQLSIAGQLITGRMAFDLDPQLRVDAELSADAIDLAKWEIGKVAAASSPARAAKPPVTFGDRPLPFDAWPAAVQLRAALKIKELVIPAAPPVSALDMIVVSERGRLAIEPLSFVVGKGQVRARVKVATSQNSSPRTELFVDARQVSVEALEVLWGAGKHFRGGRASLRADLVLMGRTPRSLAASSTGDLLLTASGVAVAGKGAALDRNIVVQLLNVLVPKQTARDDLVVECSVLRLPLRNGVAVIDRSIALETRQVAVLASGELNLVKQTVLLAFRPKAKKGLNLNAGSLVQLVLLQGPLEAPRLTLDPTGTVRLAGNLGVAMATGGASLLIPALRGKPVEEVRCGGVGARPTHGGGNAAPSTTERTLRGRIFGRR